MASTSNETNAEVYESAEKKLNDLMNEYLAMKKIERKNVIARLHPVILKRIHALKALQKETINLDAEFHQSVYELERKLQGKHDEIFKKRSDIVNGLHEPCDNECQLSAEELEKMVPMEGEEVENGIPNFWLTVLKNVSELRSMIKEHDEPILEHLIDVRAYSNTSPNLSFQLEFQFAPNDFILNSVLTKTYLMKCVPEDDDPFSFEGPEIYKSIGCEIMWNAGKNVTEKAEKKKGSSATRLFKTDSFFNFFNPPELRMDDSDDNDKIEVKEYLESDFEIGHYLKERVIPRAVLYYTGMIDDDISDDDDDDDDDSITYHAENYENEVTDGDN
jgi:nucleosome assembly protein 1-like 1